MLLLSLSSMLLSLNVSHPGCIAQICLRSVAKAQTIHQVFCSSTSSRDTAVRHRLSHHVGAIHQDGTGHAGDRTGSCTGTLSRGAMIPIDSDPHAIRHTCICIHGVHQGPGAHLCMQAETAQGGDLASIASAAALIDFFFFHDVSSPC